jgi:PAS domain S-box-containing protein
MITTSTASELAKTGIDVIGNVRWGTHFCSFYESNQDLLETLVPYFKAGLECEEFCVWVVPEALSPEEAKQALAQTVPDLDRHLAEGNLEIHCHDKWYLHDGRWDPQRVFESWREKFNYTRANGYRGLRVSGDVGWACNDDWTAIREYEKQISRMLVDQRSIILCTYPLAKSLGNQVFDAAHIHEMAVARRNGSWEMVETPDLKEAKAEIKRLNEALEQKVEKRTGELAAANEALRSEIAERKLAGEALRRAEDRIRLVIDTIPTMAWSLKPDGVVDFVNERWVDYTGVSFQDAIREPNGIVHPEDLQRVLQNWLGDMAAGKPSEDEMRLRRGDGEYRWFLVRTVPLVDEQGNIVRWYGTSTDIEDRKRAEEALRKSEKLFTAFMDHIPGFAWMKDIEGRYVYVNKNELELDVYRAGVIGKTDAELWPAEIAATYRANDELVITTRETVQTVEPSLTNGEQSYMLVSKFPIFDKDGAVVMIGGAGVDITDLTQARDALNAQALRYKTLMATSTDSIYVLDEKGDLQEANAAFLNRRGYSATEMQGLNVTDWDAQLSREGLKERLRTLAGGSAVFETRHRCKDGSAFDVEVCATGVQIDGEQLFFCVTRDITERKQTEEARARGLSLMVAALESTADGILVVNTEGKIDTFNRLFARMWRLSEEVLASKEDARALQCALDQLTEPEKFLEKVHYLYQHPEAESFDRLVFKDGRVFERYSRPQLIGGKVAGRVWSFRDVTERRRAAEELEEANRQLRILSRQLFHVQEEERRHLARELHDEIGQTLTAAKINLKILARDMSAEVTGRLDDSVQLLDRLLRQVRELSLDLRPPLLDELGLAPTLRWLVDQQAQRAGLRVTFSANVDGLDINPDTQTACFRVAQEAITNIIRHAGATNVVVEVLGEADRLTLRVCDDGGGFDPAVIQKRAAQDFTLGLVSMKERALLVRGGFEVQSVPGKGTEIRAWFPLAPGEHLSTETL